MSKANELAFTLEKESDSQFTAVKYSTAKKAAAELRRLAEIERKYNEVMAQEPVGYLHDLQEDGFTQSEQLTFENIDPWGIKGETGWEVITRPVYTLKKE